MEQGEGPIYHRLFYFSHVTVFLVYPRWLRRWVPFQASTPPHINLQNHALRLHDTNHKININIIVGRHFKMTIRKMSCHNYFWIHWKKVEKNFKGRKVKGSSEKSSRQKYQPIAIKIYALVYECMSFTECSVNYKSHSLSIWFHGSYSSATLTPSNVNINLLPTRV